MGEWSGSCGSTPYPAHASRHERSGVPDAAVVGLLALAAVLVAVIDASQLYVNWVAAGFEADFGRLLAVYGAIPAAGGYCTC